MRTAPSEEHQEEDYKKEVEGDDVGSVGVGGGEVSEYICFFQLIQMAK